MRARVVCAALPVLRVGCFAGFVLCACVRDRCFLRVCACVSACVFCVCALLADAGGPLCACYCVCAAVRLMI
jgi:hypothetical protein